MVDLADEEHVIAGRMQRMMTTLDPGCAVFDEWHASPSRAVGHAREAIRVRAGKAPRELYLIVRENVYCVAFGAFKYGKTARSAREAPDDERGI